MVAYLHKIESKTRGTPLDFSLMEQFELNAGQEVSADSILHEGIWHPYTLDVDHAMLTFLDMSSDVDLSQEAFMFSRQYEEATHLLRVPYAELMPLAEQVTIPEHVIFAFSIGRCGSTLLHQIFNQMAGVYSYSEPDVPTILSLYRLQEGMSDTLIGNIIEAGTRLQIVASAPKDATHIVQKFRGQVNPLMPYYFERFPRGKMIFMYRDTLKWAQSTFRFLMKFYDDDTVSLEEIHYLFRMYPEKTLATIPHYLDMSKERFHRAEQIALLLIFQLEIYMQYASTHKLFPLHYDDMLADPENVISALLDYCDIPQTALAHALKGLERDSQEGTLATRSAARSHELDQTGEKFFRDVLAKHPVFGQADFRL